MKNNIRYIVLLLSINVGCINKSLPKRLIPEAYNFPEKEIGLGKTMVYVNEKTKDTSFIEFFHQIINGKKLVIQQSRDKNVVDDSMIFSGRRVIDYYIKAFTNHFWKANFISDTIVEDRDGKLNELFEFKWNIDSNHLSIKQKVSITKDTTYVWNRKSYPAIIVNSTIDTKSDFLKSPNGAHDFRMILIDYLCKDIGSVRKDLIVEWYDKPVITDLVAIKEISGKNH